MQSKSKTENGYGTLPYIRYVRRSRDRTLEESKSTSVRKQEEQTTRLAEFHGVDVLPEFFVDLNFSGGTHDRPAFNRALDLIRAGQAGGIIVVKQNRFSRNKRLIIDQIGEIQDAGGRLICGDTGLIDIDDDGDYIRVCVSASQADRELRDRREYGREAREQAIEDGISLGCPFGYERGPDKRLVVVPAEAAIVAYVFEARIAGGSWPGVARALNADDRFARPDGRAWTQGAIGRMIANRTYTGEARSGEFVNANAHDPIVSDETFEAANDRRGARVRRGTPKTLLAGIVRCASCGYRMAKTSGGDPVRPYYKCRRTHVGGRCEAPVSVPADKLDAHVLAEVAEGLAEARVQTGALTTDDLSRADAEVAAAEAKTAAIVKDRLANIGDASESEREVWNRVLAEARESESEARRERELVRGRILGNVALPETLDADGVLAMDFDGKRDLLVSVVAAVAVRRAGEWRESIPKRSRIFLTGEAPSDLPGAGGARYAAPRAIAV